MRLGWRKKRRRSRPASAATVRITPPPSPLPVSLANTSASVGRLVAMLASRPRGNSSAMRGTSSWPRGASHDDVAVDDPAREPSCAVTSARSSSGCSPRTRTTSPATWARSSSGVPSRGHPPAVEHRDAVAALGLLGLVRRDDDAHAARRRAAPRSRPRCGAAPRDRRRGPARRAAAAIRLVQQHARDLDAAAHAARILRRRPRRRDAPSAISASASSIARVASARGRP